MKRPLHSYWVWKRNENILYNDFVFIFKLPSVFFSGVLLKRDYSYWLNTCAVEETLTWPYPMQRHIHIPLLCAIYQPLSILLSATSPRRECLPIPLVIPKGMPIYISWATKKNACSCHLDYQDKNIHPSNITKQTATTTSRTWSSFNTNMKYVS